MRVLVMLTVLLMTLAASEGIAQKKKKSKKNAVVEPQARKPQNKNGIKPYKKVITNNAITDTGLFTTHKVDDKYYFELPDSLLEREILVVSRISGTIENFNFGGAGMKARGQQVWRWQKKDNKLLVRSVSFNSVASEEKPIYESVKSNNFEPVLAAFSIKAIGKDSSSYVVEVNDFFTSDIPVISPLNVQQRKNFGVKNLDRKRSLIVSAKSFPMNTEVRHILTYNASKLPSNAQTGTLSIEMNQSMVLLPKVPMKPRLFDNRVGYFSVRQKDYGTDEHRVKNRRYITRWRLEPKDPEAFKRGELVEPTKPIVYYIDPNTPEKWREYLKQGVEDWQIAFEEAGFKNAILAKDPPTKEENPDWTPEDIRYSVIRYTANPIQNAMGPHVHDPRSGEIIESDIIWYHNVMNLLRNWYFIQTAAVNDRARKTKLDDEVMGQLIRFVCAHEVGHTLGFPHNMGASNAYPVDSLRSPSFTKKMGTAPSIMDYARFNYVAQPGDGASLFPNIGVYDKWAVKWGYTPLLQAVTADQEKKTLQKWIRNHENDPKYWFGAQKLKPIDPRAQTEDLGDDAMKASSYGLLNLERITKKLIDWTQESGKDFDDLNELYGNIVTQWRRYAGHVKSNIGGVYETHKTYDQEGLVYEFVAKDKQQEAMDWLQKKFFTTPKWLIDNEILMRVEGTGSLERIRRTQARVLDEVLEAGRLARLIEAEANLGNNTYTVVSMMSDLRNGLWSELRSTRKIDAYRRNLQRAYIERLGFLMTNEQQTPANSAFRNFMGITRVDVSQSDIRTVVRAELKNLQAQIRNNIGGVRDQITKYHLQDVLERVDVILNPVNLKN